MPAFLWRFPMYASQTITESTQKEGALRSKAPFFHKIASWGSDKLLLSWQNIDTATARIYSKHRLISVRRCLLPASIRLAPVNRIPQKFPRQPGLFGLLHLRFLWSGKGTARKKYGTA